MFTSKRLDRVLEQVIRHGSSTPLPNFQVEQELAMEVNHFRRFVSMHANQHQIFRFISQSLERLLDYGRPNVAVYRLFEELYFESMHECVTRFCSAVTRYLYLDHRAFAFSFSHSVETFRQGLISELPIAPEQTAMIRIYQRELNALNIDWKTYTGHDPAIIERISFLRGYDHFVTRPRDIFGSLRLLDVRTVGTQINVALPRLRDLVQDVVATEVEMNSGGVSQDGEGEVEDAASKVAAKDDLFDLLRIYGILAPLFAENREFLEELDRRYRNGFLFTEQGREMVIGETVAARHRKSRPSSQRQHSHQQASQRKPQFVSESMPRCPSRAMFQIAEATLYTLRHLIVDVYSPARVIQALQDGPWEVVALRASYHATFHEFLNQMEKVFEDDAFQPVDVGKHVDELGPSDHVPNELDSDATVAVDELILDTSTLELDVAEDETTTAGENHVDSKDILELESTLIPLRPCEHLSTSNIFRYAHTNFFWNKPLGHNSKRTYHHVQLDRNSMHVLCQLRGAIKGGENLAWSTVVKLVETQLHGSVELKGGSRTTFFVPTPHAYAIAVDRPHPSNRIGHKIYQLRDVLFKKFGIDVDAFEAV